MTEIRFGRKSDFSPWSQMRTKLWPTASAEEHLEDLKKFFEDNLFQGWFALEKGNYIGFAEAYIRPFANGCDNQPVVFLEGIWVEESQRKKGVGRSLIKEVEEWAIANRVYEIGSDTEIENTSSQKTHVKWGFEETERVVYFRKKLEE